MLNLMWADAPKAEPSAAAADIEQIKTEKVVVSVNPQTAEVTFNFTGLKEGETVEFMIAADRKFRVQSQLLQSRKKRYTLVMEPGLHFVRYRYMEKGAAWSETYKIDLFIAGESAAPQDENAADHYVEKGFQIWLGTGLSSFAYDQVIPSRADDSFGHESTGSYFVKLNYQLSSRWNLDLSYGSTPSEFEITNVPIDDNEFAWTTIALDADWSFSPAWLGSHPLYWGARGGLAMQKMPFLHINSVGDLLGRHPDVNTLSLGPWARWELGRWNLTADLRYIYLLSEKAPGGELDFKSKLSYEAGLSVGYRFGRRWLSEFALRMQNYDLDFTYDDGVIQSAGTTQIGLTSFELRLGYRF
jgi:hypothetical protein